MLFGLGLSGLLLYRLWCGLFFGGRLFLVFGFLPFFRFLCRYLGSIFLFGFFFPVFNGLFYLLGRFILFFFRFVFGDRFRLPGGLFFALAGPCRPLLFFECLVDGIYYSVVTVADSQLACCLPDVFASLFI